MLARSLHVTFSNEASSLANICIWWVRASGFETLCKMVKEKKVPE